MSSPQSRYAFGKFETESETPAWRKSLWKSTNAKRKDPNEILEEREKVAQFANENEHLFSLKGVSLMALNEFWKEVRANVRYKNMELFTINKAVGGVPAGSTVLKEQDCQEADTVLFRCFHPDTQGYITIDERDVTEKPRRNWTIKDLSVFAIFKDVSITKKPFLERLEEEAVGKPFSGCYITYSSDSLFEDLLIALRSMVSDGGAPAAHSFFWLEIFCTTIPVIQEYTRQDDTEKLKSVASMFTRLSELFDQRLIHFTNWHNPDILGDLSSVYTVFNTFSKGLSFEIVMKSTETKNFISVYDSDEPGIFKVINDMDPSGLGTGAYGKQFSDFLVDELTCQEFGFESVKQSLTTKIRRFFVKEVEDHVKTFVEAEDPVKSEQFAIFLYKAGNFLRKHDELEVASTYFAKAKANYDQLQQINERMNKKDVEVLPLQEVLAIDRINGGASKVYMYQAQVALVKKDMKRCGELLQRSEDEAKKIHTQKHAFFMDISEVRAEYQLQNKNLPGSIDELTAMMLILKEERGKPSRQKLVSTALKLGSRLMKNKELKKAMNVFATAKSTAAKEYGVKHPEYARILVAQGSLAFKQEKDANANALLLEAENIFLESVGCINPDIAKVRSNIGQCFARSGGKENSEDAFHWYQKAEYSMSKSSGLNNVALGRILSASGLVLKHLERQDEAEEMFIRALQCLTNAKKNYENDPEAEQTRKILLANTYSNIGQAQEHHDRLLDAARSYKQAYELTKVIFGENNSKTVKRKDRWLEAENLAGERKRNMSVELLDVL